MSAMLAERPTVAPSIPGPCPVIETARLVLRPHRMQDADAIVTSLSDFAVARMLTRVPVPYDQEDGRDWLNMVTSAMKPDWHFAITLDGVHVGVASLEVRHGLWHIGSARVEAAGGGCTAPSVVRAEAGWEERLGQVLGKRFVRGEDSRLRLQVSHPMDNGLVGGIPEFFLNQAELRDSAGNSLATLELFAAVSENPTISLEVKGEGETTLWLRDNNGNEFEAAF